MFYRVLLSIVLVSSTVHAGWFEQQRERSFNYLLENISRYDTPRGFVVASPSKRDPNYYYHWVRDAALVMRALDKNLKYTEEKKMLFSNYIDLVAHHQNIFKLSDLGEPKFNPNGTSYQGAWGRPQNDGPALRVITLVHHAHELILNGHMWEVRKRLYGSGFPATTVIKKDLEYISRNWRDPDFDLWEEVKGTHFYTRMVQRTALVLGARLADQLGDSGAADWYRSQAEEIGHELEYHWNDKQDYIVSTIFRVGGLDYKYSNLDTSVILAVNHAWIPGLTFGPDDERIIKTYRALVAAFKEIYPINHNGDGVAIGRYPEDRYYGGNPWFLLTNGMAEYLWKLRTQLLDKQMHTNWVTRIDQEMEGYLKRVKHHMGEGGRMDEQIDKYSGYMLSARDLTWSYASFLTIGIDEN